MKKGISLFLTLLIFLLSLGVQSGPTLPDTAKKLISASATVSYAQPIAGCGDGSPVHPCHFGHLGGCAPIQCSELFFAHRDLELVVHAASPQLYSSPYLDAIERPPIFIS